RYLQPESPTCAPDRRQTPPLPSGERSPAQRAGEGVTISTSLCPNPLTPSLSPAGRGRSKRLQRQFRRRLLGRNDEAQQFRHRRKAAAMMNGGAQLRERLEMLGHAIAHVALEAVAGMGQPEPPH